jgi:hypothetical protein
LQRLRSRRGIRRGSNPEIFPFSRFPVAFLG